MLNNRAHCAVNIYGHPIRIRPNLVTNTEVWLYMYMLSSWCWRHTCMYTYNTIFCRTRFRFTSLCTIKGATAWNVSHWRPRHYREHVTSNWRHVILDVVRDVVRDVVHKLRNRNVSALYNRIPNYVVIVFLRKKIASHVPSQWVPSYAAVHEQS